MATSHLSIHCASYEDLAAADADFQALVATSRRWPDAAGSPADAVVIGRRGDGRTMVYRESREPSLSPDDRNLPSNLALGTAIALMPAVAAQASMWNQRSASDAAALADHVVRSTSRDDLSALGKAADAGNALLLAAVPTTHSGELAELLHHSIGSEARVVDLAPFDTAREIDQP